MIAIIQLILYVFLACLWIRVILSYVSIRPGSGAESINRGVNAVTDPVLRPLRRVLPTPRIGGGALDLSPIIASIAVIVILNLL